MSDQRDLLIEIGTEEMPARFVTDAINQFKEKTVDWLNEQRISFGTLEAFSTPRRLAILVTRVADKQADREEEARGPAKNIAVDEEGNWTKAALGFARSQGVIPDNLVFKQVKGKDYLFANKFITGKSTVELLPAFQGLITSMSFPKSMRWNSYDLRFVRPIKWLLALYGEEVIPFSITSRHSDRKTYGHRFLGGEVKIHEPAAYKNALLAEHVIVDSEERKEAIHDQLRTLSEDNGWCVSIDEDLLEEVNNLVEYPTALYGTFAETFLDLPKEVLITSMSEHQRYFSVENKKGELLPYFVTVRNGDHQHLETVVKGNEKVLHARLSDARFFWDEDQKVTISDALERLDSIVFQEELGTMGDKVFRIRKLAKTICRFLDFDNNKEKRIDRAAEICKFDLVTHMVDEFSKLQGVIGEKYAHRAGEPREVAKAVNEHYLPRFKRDHLPETDTGAVVGIADKLDAIVGCFAIGLISTGSQDPYGLRRSASGILQVLLDRGWGVSLEALLDDALGVFENAGLLKQSRAKVKEELNKFFRYRMKTVLEERDIRYDVIDAVLIGNLSGVCYLVRKAELLMEKREEPDFKAFVETLSRVTHIADYADSNDTHVDPSLFEEEVETRLYEAVSRAEPETVSAVTAEQPLQAYRALSSLQAPINDYFDHIMVMAEDEQLKQNHLKQMNKLSKIIGSFADFNALVL